MPISDDSKAALALLKDLQANVRNTEDLRSNPQVNDDLNTLISVLESPVFQSILNIQDSLRELKKQVSQPDMSGVVSYIYISQVHLHPSILPEDFDITPSGELILNLPQAEEDSPSGNGYTNGFDTMDVAEVEKQEDGEREVPVEKELEVKEEAAGLGYDPKFQDVVEETAQGRPVSVISLTKPDGKSLGFSVVGLRSEHKGELGIYVQEIQPEGIAGLDGQLKEGDQILAIDGQVLDCNISHQQAISILQRARGQVQLVVARGEGEEETSQQEENIIPSDWCQVEVIDLLNDGTGLGFGIIGGQQTGVVVKTILPGGVADRDGRLLPGDFILQINQHWLRGVASEQVASVLRSCGTQVRLVVARPVDPGDANNIPASAPLLPTQVLNSQHQLEAHLSLAAQNASMMVNLPDFSDQYRVTSGGSAGTTAPLPTPAVTGARDLPEIETMEVELVKDSQGLGITIAGYTCEREELSGIFVKSVTEGSAADRSGQVQVNDQIVEVDGLSLQGYSNQQAVEMLRSTGRVVHLRLVRYVHGLKFEQLQQAIASSNSATPAATPSSQPEEISSPTRPAVAPPQPPKRSDSLLAEEIIAPPPPVHQQADTEREPVAGSESPEENYEGELEPEVEARLLKHWQDVLGPDYEVIVAQISKFKEGGGLGISLEGTVEKVDGEEQNPHHYIRSVLPNGPVGHNGRLLSGDELLEVNSMKLLGLYHSDVVAILKDLPIHVRIVCARPSNVKEDQKPVFSQGGPLQVSGDNH